MVGRAVLVIAVLVSLVGCGSESELAPRDAASTDQPSATAEPLESAEPVETVEPVEPVLHPDVIDVAISRTGESTFTVSATLSSPYDRPERYADAWRVLAPDGSVLGVRELLHDHAAEQPFTRSLGGVEIPPDVTEVTVEGRDQVSGWGGATFTVAVPPA